MKAFKKFAFYSIILLIISASFYWLLYINFKSSKDIEFSFLCNMAFLPIQVLLITLLLEGIQEYREKKNTLSKLNMIIGVFFSDFGIGLIKKLYNFDTNKEEIRKSLYISPDYKAGDFKKLSKALLNKSYNIDSTQGDLISLRNFLLDKKEFLTSLMSNSALLEHESFTDLVFAIFHLTDELSLMDKIKDKDQDYYNHLSKDMIRVYGSLCYHFILYAEHIKEQYPYLYKTINQNMYGGQVLIQNM